MKHAIQPLKTQAASPAALPLNRELLARIVECSSDAIFTVAAGILITWNQGAERLYGYTAEEALGKEFIGLLWPGITEEEKTRLSVCFTEEVYLSDFETLHLCKEGTEVFVNVALSPLTDAAGKFLGVSVIARGLSQARQAEALKKQMEAIRSYTRHATVQKDEIESLNARLETLAVMDSLTGLMNHQTLQRHLETECQRAARYGEPLSLLLLDIDDFRRYQETQGVAAAEAILRQVASIMQEEARTTDLVARYRAEQVCVVLTHTDHASAVTMAERCRTHIASACQPGQGITVSIGAATFSHTMETADALILEADKALYIAKQDGCNRIVHFNDRDDFTAYGPGWSAARNRSYSDDRNMASSGSPNHTAVAAVSASALRVSKKEMALAYDCAIEGWSRTLDLRDKEAAGHSQRVMEMTMRLAQEMGIRGQELVYMRWGALLHDIGKMGIPDSLLLKSGPLSPEEWEVMRSHTTLAYEMLSSIAFMHPSLDIPFSHHERWDGSGYPQGLKGEDIPLAARIFSIVDVWDALRSDRPYRRAWGEREALDHIYSLSGKHFDPQVVQAFHQMMLADGDLSIGAEAGTLASESTMLQ